MQGSKLEGSMLRWVGLVVLVPFAVLTGVAISVDGSSGFSNAITLNLLSFQIWLDLVIAMLFWAAWLLVDAKAHGRWPWVWLIAAFAFGAFVPLLYMILYQRWPATPGVSASTAGSARARQVLGGVLLVVLGAVTVAGLLVDGTDVFGTVTYSWSNIQIWVDLVVVILLWIPWMLRDARAHGQNPWGWVVFAIALGSFAPLAYLTLYGRWPASHPVAQDA